MSQYAAMIVFGDNSKTYEAYTKLTNTSGQLGVVSAAILERDPDGRLHVPERGDATAGTGLAAGSLIGMLVGVLGGPLGVLLGWSAGAAGGALAEATRADDTDAVLDRVSSLVPPGGNAIIAQTDEETTGALDAFVSDLGGQVTRSDLGEVVAEMEAQQQAADDAAKAARKAMREYKRGERKEKLQDRVDALKARFQRSN